ncbi:Major facilitator transporter-like protein [Mycena chlorophos]|uniref:Major facilitator transporter-like protein n=1 Tax=Mycena chlorophos TaxID=658473 RepID=A0A8H6WAL4_MYCCL|nr:Major facilitator transporter-like protein [Mycena chlorophos]
MMSQVIASESRESLRTVNSAQADAQPSPPPSPAPKPEPAAASKPNATSSEGTILTGSKLAVVFTAMLLTGLLIALDQTILSTALPQIATSFNSFTLQGWISSSFILAQTVFLLFYGQLLRVFPAKYTMLFATALFELGSIVCATAQNVGALVAGRTVSGVGAAGILVSMIQIIAQTTRLQDRPRLFAIVGAIFGLAAIIGPLIGGALTDRAGWRWCFILNLPFGALSLFFVSILVKPSPPLGSDPSKRSYRDLLEQTRRLDFVGATLVAATVTILVLALQWGGNTKPWSSPAVITCLALTPVLATLTIIWEIKLGERAMVPTKSVFKSRSIYAIILFAFLTRFAQLLYSYYIPIFYQAARHRSPIQSGLNLLAFMLGSVGGMIGSGQLVSQFGFYHPFLLATGCFLVVGSGLLYTVSPSTSSNALIGYQILAGIGIGLGTQNPLLAMQAEFTALNEMKLIAQASSMASFGQFLGGTLGLGAAEPIFASMLAKNLKRYAPDAPANVVTQDPTTIYTALSPEQIPEVVKAYTEALRVVFLLGVPIGILALAAALCIKGRKIQKVQKPPVKDAEKGA